MKIESLDKITSGHVWSRVQAAADEMEATLRRQAFSSALAKEGDCAAVVFGANGTAWTQGSRSNPFQAALLSVWTRAWRGWEQTAEEGTLWVSNDPYEGGSSLSDIRMCAPIFFEGEQVGLLGCSGHLSDIGGRTAGGVSPGATDVQQEGIRICPTVVARKWTPVDDVFRLLVDNSRFPDEMRGDLIAFVDGLKAGAERMSHLFERYGQTVVTTVEEDVRTHAENTTAVALGEIQNGVYTCKDRLDGDGLVDEPLHLFSRIDCSSDGLKFDFQGTSGSATGPMNVPADAVEAACLVAFRHVFPELPMHGAVSECLKVNHVSGSLLDARFPMSVGGSSAEVVPRIVTLCVEGLSQGVHGRAMGGGGGVTRVIIQGHSGYGPYRMCLALGSGGGASGKGDGLCNGDGSTRFTCFQDLEALETQFPIRILSYGLRPGSGGAGRYLGGCGCNLVFELLEGPGWLTLFGDRFTRGPGGTHRGTRGRTAEVRIWRNGHWQGLPHRTKVEGLLLQAGDRVRVATAGGGGYGHPFERAIRLVSKDVKFGHLSLREAALRHGVLFTCDQATDFDSAQTFKLRSYRLTAADVEGILDDIECLDDHTV